MPFARESQMSLTGLTQSKDCSRVRYSRRNEGHDPLDLIRLICLNTEGLLTPFRPLYITVIESLWPASAAIHVRIMDRYS